jgi:hypothetical protein
MICELEILSPRKKSIGWLKVEGNQKVIKATLTRNDQSNVSSLVFHLQDIQEGDFAFREIISACTHAEKLSESTISNTQNRLGLLNNWPVWLSMGYWNMRILVRAARENTVCIECYFFDEQTNQCLHIIGFSDSTRLKSFGESLEILLAS